MTGAISGTSCGEVINVTASGLCPGGARLFPDGSCDPVSFIIEGANLVSVMGDSGGPVYSGGVVHGLVSASSIPNPNLLQRVIVTQLDLSISDLGVDVVTFP